MNNRQRFDESKRQTTAEGIFLSLYSDIISMELKPGTKLSEVEIAKQYDVSRQPVREAFMRLNGLNLLLIRPQKATLIPKISLKALKNTRFIRAAVEVEVVRQACEVATKDSLAALRTNLERQGVATKTKNSLLMRELDYEFHRLVCVSADCLPAFKIIADHKAHTDRVCSLELSDVSGMAEVLEGHTNMIDAISVRDKKEAVKSTRHHLTHLNGTIRNACKNHPDFFDD